ncbi:MAG: hypothetical protein JXA83_15715 [Acidimicrobiales bacterium]|nr:hypothetical protein [Acidimicrobiales bacterium]
MRLFVAVHPPRDVEDVLAALHRPPRDGVRWTGPPDWHVTLRFLGEVDDPVPVADALDVADLAPCQAVLGPAVAVLGRGLLVVPVTGVDVLAAAVVGATAHVGAPPDPRPFRGHVTLARARRGRVGGLAGEAVAARFPVTEVRLVRSNLGQGSGPRYEVLHVRRLT